MSATDETVSVIAPGEISRPQRLAVSQFDIDAGVILRELRHFNAAIDQHLELADPAGENPFDVLLLQPETVREAGGLRKSRRAREY